MGQSSFTDLRVWREAMSLATEIYSQTISFPKHETYALTQQIRRAAVSVPSNIAEGKGRGSAREFRQFLYQSAWFTSGTTNTAYDCREPALPVGATGENAASSGGERWKDSEWVNQRDWREDNNGPPTTNTE